MRIRCTTTVDITATGVKNRFYKSRMPFRDQLGRLIDTDAAWHQSRAQQSNWETVNQLISLRTLTEEVSLPEHQQDNWQFEFEVTDAAAWSQDDDALGLLKQDCDQVPVMPTCNSAETLLRTTCDANCWFDVVTESHAK